MLNKLKNDPRNASLKKELTDIQKQSDLLNNHVKNVDFSDHATRGGLTGQQKIWIVYCRSKNDRRRYDKRVSFYKTNIRSSPAAGARIAYGLSMNAATGITHIGLVWLVE